MAVGVDNTSGGTTAPGMSSASWSHTCGSLATDLAVHIGTASNGDVVSGVTYNGVSLTLKASDTSQTPKSAWTWTLDSPPIGTHTVVVTMSAACTSITCIGISFTDSFGIKDPLNNGGHSASSSITNTGVTASDMVCDFQVCANGVSYASIQTQQKSQGSPQVAGVTSTATGSGSVTMGYNYTVGGFPYTDYWAITSIVMSGGMPPLNASDTFGLTGSVANQRSLQAFEQLLFSETKIGETYLTPESEVVGLQDVRLVSTNQSDSVGLTDFEQALHEYLFTDTVSFTQTQFGLKFKYLLEIATVEIDDAHVSLSNKMLTDTASITDTGKHGPSLSEVLSLGEGRTSSIGKVPQQVVGFSDSRSFGYTKVDTLGLQDLRASILNKYGIEAVTLTDASVRMLVKYLLEPASLSDFHDISHHMAVLDVFAVVETFAKQDSIQQAQNISLQENTAHAVSKMLQDVFSAIDAKQISTTKFVQQIFGLTDTDFKELTKVLTLPISIADAKAVAAIKILGDTYGLTDEEVGYILGSYTVRTRGSIRAGNRNAGW